MTQETAKERIENETTPDYWIISGQVFKNKENFVKQQMGFNPGDIRENWESSFDHFAIPVYRNPIFVSEYENGVKTSFVRKNKVLQEQLNTAKKALTEISDGTMELSIDDFNASSKASVEAIYAEQVLAAIENEGSGDE
ncbi:hypothetical protein [Lactococcus sp. S47]|uniref:hypothetical protein n=1 Tax=Lactococcus sp. S47 TaxID=2767460 RepID=UPI0019083FAC|nr:hypothetical protein [Lactococcus sp. S47]MBK0029235.1 hypothetical protein [Lactococcus sp. S47]